MNNSDANVWIIYSICFYEWKNFASLFQLKEVKFQILEPRDQLNFRDPSKHSGLPDHKSVDYIPVLSYLTPLRTIDKREHDDEVRKPMIIKQLNQLTRKRFEIIQDNANLSVDSKKGIKDDFDLKIMLLQEELNKLMREEEMFKIHRYSNNPYFSVNNPRATYSDHHLKSETSPENAMDVADLTYKSYIKSF